MHVGFNLIINMMNLLKEYAKPPYMKLFLITRISSELQKHKGSPLPPFWPFWADELGRIIARRIAQVLSAILYHQGSPQCAGEYSALIRRA